MQRAILQVDDGIGTHGSGEPLAVVLNGRVLEAVAKLEVRGIGPLGKGGVPAPQPACRRAAIQVRACCAGGAVREAAVTGGRHAGLALRPVGAGPAPQRCVASRGIGRAGCVPVARPGDGRIGIGARTATRIAAPAGLA